MTITLPQMLDLVGKLDDAPAGDDTPRERFRRFLTTTLTDAGQIRDYVDVCLRTSGDQYNRALQDLVNSPAASSASSVSPSAATRAVQPSQIGFDGHWTSPTGFHIVVEAKTTDVYAMPDRHPHGLRQPAHRRARPSPTWDQRPGPLRRRPPPIAERAPARRTPSVAERRRRPAPHRLRRPPPLARRDDAGPTPSHTPTSWQVIRPVRADHRIPSWS